MELGWQIGRFLAKLVFVSIIKSLIIKGNDTLERSTSNWAFRSN